ncbi:MAG TPA: hypothetical protein PKH07_09610 [bacterium]|nr:hypothetical protein [bacterium]
MRRKVNSGGLTLSVVKPTPTDTEEPLKDGDTAVLLQDMPADVDGIVLKVGDCVLVEQVVVPGEIGRSLGAVTYIMISKKTYSPDGISEYNVRIPVLPEQLKKVKLY